MKKTAVSGS